MDIYAWVSLSENFWNSQKVLAARMQGFLFRLCMCVYSTQRALLRVDIYHICRSHHSFNGGSALFVVSPLHFSEFLLLLLPADEWIINKRISRVGIIHDAGGGTVHALLYCRSTFVWQPTQGKTRWQREKKKYKNMYTRRERMRAAM
jgi:hypothetical protein